MSDMKCECGGNYPIASTCLGCGRRVGLQSGEPAPPEPAREAATALHRRMVKHWRPRIGYHELMQLVFPESEYPRAWRYSQNGGPPGCAMPFGKALRELGLSRNIDGDRIEGTPNTSLSVNASAALPSAEGKGK